MSSRSDRGRTEAGRDLSKVQIDDLITREAFARMLGKTPTRISQMMLRKHNDLPEPVRLGRSTMFVRQEAEAYVKAHPPTGT